ncbi:hypothetical protein MNBD_IGNAVI01-2989 [hydrothermal vent metagenome]|uniref:Uncharacterized protein n=1 Tax=hydrothermal vent metagenome TaxID=652676 RepID=A0A3B1C1R2_9ZZZZ
MNEKFYHLEPTLSELDDFESKVELLVCDMRKNVIKPDINFASYLDSLKSIMDSHQQNLHNISQRVSLQNRTYKKEEFEKSLEIN